MMNTHTPAGGHPVPCQKDTGRCRICELIDPDSPEYQESYRRLYHPEEFLTVDVPEYAHVPSQLPPASPVTPNIPLMGDLATRAIATFGGDRIAKYISEKLGVPCGCIERAQKLNKLDRKIRDYLFRKHQVS